MEGKKTENEKLGEASGNDCSRNPVSHTLSRRDERLCRLIHLPPTLFLTEGLKRI